MLRFSDERDVVVARPQGKRIEGYETGAEIEPAGLVCVYTTAAAGHTVFVPWKTLQACLRRSSCS